jgi:hypothetical protein
VSGLGVPRQRPLLVGARGRCAPGATYIFLPGAASHEPVLVASGVLAPRPAGPPRSRVPVRLRHSVVRKPGSCSNPSTSHRHRPELRSCACPTWTGRWRHRCRPPPRAPWSPLRYRLERTDPPASDPTVRASRTGALEAVCDLNIGEPRYLREVRRRTVPSDPPEPPGRRRSRCSGAPPPAPPHPGATRGTQAPSIRWAATPHGSWGYVERDQR